MKKRSPSSAAIGVFCIMVATLCFAFQGIIIKKLYLLDVSVYAMLLWRMVLFMPFYVAYLYWRQPDALKPMGLDTLKIMAIGVIGFFMIPSTIFIALKDIAAGIERILLYTYPLFVMLLHAVYTRKLPAQQHIVAFFVIQVGIFLLIGGGESLDLLKLSLAPALLVLFAAVLFALYTLLIKSHVEKYGSMRFFLYGITGALICIVFTYVLFESKKTWPGELEFIYLFLMMLISFPPSILFAEGVGRIGATRAALISTLGPVITVIAAQYLLGETLAASQIAGGAVVMLMISALEGRAIRNLWVSIRKARK